MTSGTQCAVKDDAVVSGSNSDGDSDTDMGDERHGDLVEDVVCSESAETS